MLLMYSMIVILITHSMSSNYVSHLLMTLNSIVLILVTPIPPTSLLLFSILLFLIQTKIHYFMLYLPINIHYSYTCNNCYLNILFTLNLTVKTKMMSNYIPQIIMVLQMYYLNILIIKFDMLFNLILLFL